MRLRVDTREGQVIFTSGPIALQRADVEVTLAVPISEEPVAADDRAALGKHLQQARIGHLNDVVRLLSGDRPISGRTPGLPDIPMLTRQAMLDKMEQAFLDPTGALRQAAGEVPSLQELHDPERAQAYADRLQAHHQSPEVKSASLEMLGKAASFASLAEVDWAIDAKALQDGKLGAAINKFSDQYKARDIGRVRLPRESNLTKYRDYLLAIWTTYAPQIVYLLPHQLTEAQALHQLETRFHQEFTTHDDTPRNANTVLIEIVRTILTAPTGRGFGFGIAESSIAAQGTRTPRAYLDYLISLTHLSAPALGLRYRLDLMRPDGELSSPVQENVGTLQGFFRDRSALDPRLPAVVHRPGLARRPDLSLLRARHLAAQLPPQAA